MTTGIVMSVTDELVAELEEECRLGADQHGGMGNDYDSSLFDRIGDTLLALLAERAELNKQNDELRQMLAEKVISQTMLTNFVSNGGGFTIGFEGGACALFAHAFGEQLYASGAENYIECSFESSQHKDLGQIVITAKRETGLTPHQLRLAAEQDTVRLDWFIKECCVMECMNGSASPVVYRIYWSHEAEGQREWYASPRAAIDAAMQSEAKP